MKVVGVGQLAAIEETGIPTLDSFTPRVHDRIRFSFLHFQGPSPISTTGHLQGQSRRGCLRILWESKVSSTCDRLAGFSF